jgi:hypothetical protein
MIPHRFLIAFILSFVLAGFIFTFPTFGVANQEAAFSKISEAEDALLAAYGAVLEAERAGANISRLLIRLNEAGAFLSRAKLAYGTEDFDSAVHFADQSLTKLNGSVTEANRLKWSAEHAGYWDFLVNFAGSGVGALSIFVVSLVVWTALKRREQSGGKV